MSTNCGARNNSVLVKSTSADATIVSLPLRDGNGGNVRAVRPKFSVVHSRSRPNRAKQKTPVTGNLMNRGISYATNKPNFVVGCRVVARPKEFEDLCQIVVDLQRLKRSVFT